MLSKIIKNVNLINDSFVYQYNLKGSKSSVFLAINICNVNKCYYDVGKVAKTSVVSGLEYKIEGLPDKSLRNEGLSYYDPGWDSANTNRKVQTDLIFF